MTDGDYLLELDAVTRTYQVGTLLGGKRTLHALRGVDLQVRRGETLGLVGESGCGKSTLSRMILGLEAPTSGTVRVAGRTLRAMNRLERARLIQPVFQDPYSSLNPRMTITALVTAPLEVQGTGDARSRRTRALEMLAEVGLPRHLVDVYPGQLSGGQRQRVAIARALIGNPGILICDEPTSALDVSVQSQILNLLNRLKRDHGVTLVLISHDLSVIRHLSDRVVVMYLGQIVEQGAAQEVFQRPRHPYSRLLTRTALPVLPGAALPAPEVSLDFPSPLAPPTGCAFHPRCPRAEPLCARTVPDPHGTALSGCRCHFPLTGSDVTKTEEPCQ